MGARVLRRRPSIPGWALALGIYLVASLGLIARQTISDPSHGCVCIGPAGDPPFFMWALKWWPYTITHGLNPFYSHVVWYPGGANIAAVTGIPGPALVLWPVTSLLGPVVAYNVAAVLAPALSALGGYALCRQLTGGKWPSVAGGFIYGFSSYELGQLTSHLHIALVFLVPLVPLLVVRRHAGVDTRARFVVGLAAVLAAQVLISTEITFDVVLLGAIGLPAAWVLAPAGSRRSVLALVPEILAAGLLALAAVSPYLYWALIESNVADYGQVTGTVFAERYRLYPLNLVVPTPITWVGGQLLPGLNQFEGGNAAEAGGYLGIPLLLLFGAFGVTTRRQPSTRLLVLMFAVTGVLALGPRLTSGSRTLIPLPWRLVESAPVFKAVLPTRFALFLALLVAVAVALELARPRRRAWLAWTVALVGIAAVLPDPTSVFWHSRTQTVPRVVTDAKRYLPPDGSVLMVPVGQFGSSMYWQAAAGFDFCLANGRVGLVLPPEYGTEPASLAMANNVGPPHRTALVEFLLSHRVRAVVVQPALRARWDPPLRRLGLRPRDVDGVAVYYVCGLPPRGRPCGQRAPAAASSATRSP